MTDPSDQQFELTVLRLADNSGKFRTPNDRSRKAWATEQLEHRGLIKSHDYCDQWIYWSLTDAGRAVLASVSDSEKASPPRSGSTVSVYRVWVDTDGVPTLASAEGTVVDGDAVCLKHAPAAWEHRLWWPLELVGLTQEDAMVMWRSEREDAVHDAEQALGAARDLRSAKVVKP